MPAEAMGETPVHPASLSVPPEATTARWSAWLRGHLPEGRELPEDVWRARHRVILLVVYAHAVGLAIFGFYRGWGPYYSIGEGLAIGLLGLLAAVPTLGRRFRSSVAALALVTSSAVLVQFWGGYIEGHFHYFVIVAIVSLYQDWIPFLLAILYVAVDHGAIGTLAPQWVYSQNQDAIDHPWEWATIHAAFVLAECVALLAAWRASEQARAQSELVLQSTGEGLIGLAPDGRVTFTNPAAADLTGWTPQALVGADVSRVLPGLTVEEPATNGHVHTAEGTLVRRDGRELPVEVVQTPMRGGAGGGSVVSIKDLTDRKHAEEERTQSVARQGEIIRLQEQDAFKTLFINTAAHELRTPMTPIKIHIHVLESGKRGALNPEQMKTVEILKRNLDRLGSLIEDVLNVSRLQAGHLTLERKQLALDRLVRETGESFHPVAEREGVNLQVRASDGVDVDADPKRVAQVLFNLLDNALKFTPAGGRIDLTLRADRGWAEVEVRDTGAGLRAEDIARLFKPFVQVHDPMQKTRSGSGLGLYISKGIVELHGGHMRCESPGPGKGSSFIFTLPLGPGPS